MFGQDKSELLIKQDEAADKANEEYRKVAKESTESEGNDVAEGEVERYFTGKSSKILGTNVLPENKVKTDESQIKPVEPTNAGKNSITALGMAGSEQNSKAVRTKI